jgi:hypothetical protein
LKDINSICNGKTAGNGWDGWVVSHSLSIVACDEACKKIEQMEKNGVCVLN